jgi:hypothetical protein
MVEHKGRFTKGHKKQGGRQKGSGNKINMAVAQRLAELGCDPIEGLARMAMDKDTPRELKFRCNAELAQYVQPKRRAVEVSGPGGDPLSINVSGLDVLKSRIDSLAQRRGA